MLLDSLVRMGDSLTATFPAGLLYVWLARERMLASVDSAAQAEYQVRHDPSVAPTVADIPPGARIAVLTVSRDCRQARPTP